MPARSPKKLPVRGPSSSNRRGRATKQSRRPQFEQLELRATPSADLFQNMLDEITEQAPQVVPSAPYYLGFLRSNGSFSDLNYSGTSDASAADLQEHGKRLEVLSLAYKWNDPGNLYLNDATLRAEILQGWTYVATKAGAVNAPNWWWKAVGVPQGMSDGLVLMRSEMSSGLRGQILTKYFSTVWTPSKYDGANITYQAPMAMVDGLLRGDSSRIRDVVSKVSSELLAYSGEGIQRDLSFLQHRAGGKLNYYSGSYGLVLARDTSRIMRWGGGTPYAFGTPAVDQEMRFVVDSLAWLTRGDTLDIPSQGRSISRPGSTTNAPFVLRNAMVDLVPLGRRTDELLAAIDRYENGISDTNFLSGNKSFWKADAMANQRPDLLTTVKLLSNRTARPETAAGENTLGFFEGDGFTMFVQDGDEFGARGEQEIMPVWDWQRLPGTTVEHNGYIPYYNMFGTATNSAGSSSIVGSVSDGTYGLAAMDYRRSGVTVTAKKAWFMFDNEVVALGADIDDYGASGPVFTSLNQVLLDGPVTVQDAAGRRTFDLGDATTLSGDAWIEHDHLGYVLLDPTSQTTVQAQLQTSASGLALPVFSAWVDHGVLPQNATYAYAVVPGVSADDLDAYASNLPIKILANTGIVQAVQHTGLKQTQVAFYGAGSVQISDDLAVSASQPVNLIIKQDGDNLTITAADPRQTGLPMTIDVSHRIVGPGAKWLPNSQVTRITLAMPTGQFAGSSVTRNFGGLETDSFLVPAVADAYVRNGTYATRNFGGSMALDVQNYVAGSSREAFLRFDTSSIAGDIVYAEVRLTAVAGTTSVPIAAAAVDNNTWDESLLTWNSKPVSGLSLGQTSIKQGQTASFNVTALVQAAALGDGQVSLRIYSPKQTSYSISLGSAENSNLLVRPVLEILVRSDANHLQGEGEAGSAHSAALQALLTESLTQPLRLASFLATQALGSVFLASASPPPVVVPLPAPGLFTPFTSSSKLGRGNGQPLDAAVFGDQAVDVALGVWGQLED